MDKRLKFHNKPITVGGIRFDSKAEERRWQELLLLERAHEISDLKRQVGFDLLPTQKGENRTEQKVRYIADFSYIENGKLVVEDVKGVKTRDYVLKRKMLLYFHGISIREVG